MSDNYIINNDNILDQVTKNTSDISQLKANTKWLYKYGGIGGKSNSGSGGSGESTPIVSINLNNTYTISNNKIIILNTPGTYTLNISVSRANEKKYEISGSIANQKRPLQTKVLSFDTGYSTSYSIDLNDNPVIFIKVDTKDGYFIQETQFTCITTPYNFLLSFINNSGVEYASSDILISNIKTNGLKVKFDYSVNINSIVNYKITSNLLGNIPENEYTHLDLSTNKSGSLYFDVNVNELNNENAGQYFVSLDLLINPENGSEIQYPTIIKQCFLIPNDLFVVAYMENSNNIIYYTQQENWQENIDNISFANTGNIGICIKVFNGNNTNKKFIIPTEGDHKYIEIQNTASEDISYYNPGYNTLNERQQYTITPYIGTTGEIKITFNITYNNKLYQFSYYLYCEKAINNVDWFVDYNNLIRNYYISGDSHNFNYAYESLINISANKQEQTILCNFDNSNTYYDNTNYDMIINLGFQYNSINSYTRKNNGELDEPIIAKIYDSSQDQLTDAEIIKIYQNKIEYGGGIPCEIYFPKEDNFNKDEQNKYHLLTLFRHLIDDSGKFELVVYIDGCIENIFPSYILSNTIFNTIEFYPLNLSINLAEISFISSDKNNETNVISDNNIVKYWYKYWNTYWKQYEVTPKYDESYLTALSYLDFIIPNGKNTNNDFILNGKDHIANIARNIECPVMLLRINQYDNQGKISNNSFKNGWFLGDGTNSQEIEVASIEWSEGKSELKQVELSNVNFKWFINVQGTSTKLRKVKNLDLYTKYNSNDSNQEEVVIFSPNFDNNNPSTFLPEERFTLKADIVDSSHSNNTSIGKFVNDNTTKFADAQQTHAEYASYIKNCLLGFPVLLFIEDVKRNELNEDVSEFYYFGIYNFNLGRSSAFNLGYKDISIFNSKSGIKLLDGFNTYTIPVSANQMKNNLLIAEVQENNIPNQSERGGNVYDFSQFTENILFGGDNFPGMFGDFVISNNLQSYKTILQSFVKNIAKSGAACFTVLKKNMSAISPYGYQHGYSKAKNNDITESENYVPNFIYQAFRDINTDNYLVKFNETPDEELENYINSNNFTKQLINTICPIQSSNEEEEIHKVHLDYNSLVEYFVICMAFGLVDSVCKNLNIKTWTASDDIINSIAKWYVAFYDMDTALGKNNAGNPVSYFAFTDFWKSNDTIYENNPNYLNANIISIYRDFYPSIKTDEFEIEGYDIPSSYLFAIAKYAKYLIEDYWNLNKSFMTPQDLWGKWRQNGEALENADKFIDKYFANHLNKIPETLISLNYRFKYFWHLEDGFNNTELQSMHGRGIYRVKNWLNSRFHILDAYFNLCNATAETLKYYDEANETWDAINNIYEIGISSNTLSNIKNNPDVIIHRSLFSNSNESIKTSQEIALFVKAPELTPFILYAGEGGSSVYRYLLNNSSKEYYINFKNTGNQNVLFGGSSEWIELKNISSVIYNNTFTAYSTKLQYISGTNGICGNWNLNLPALQTLVLTSQGYSGLIRIGEFNNEKKLPNLYEINISNSQIQLEIDKSDIVKITAKNINSPKLIIQNSTNIKEISLTGSTITTIQILNKVLDILNLENVKFENLYIIGDENKEDEFITLQEYPEVPIKTLKLENIHGISISNTTEISSIILTNTSVKSLELTNCNLANLTYNEDVSIWVEVIDDNNIKLHLEKLVNLKELSLDSSIGFNEVILPHSNVIFKERCFANTFLKKITIYNGENINTQLGIIGGNSIFYDTPYKLVPNTYFGILDNVTSLSHMFAIINPRQQILSTDKNTSILNFFNTLRIYNHETCEVIGGDNTPLNVTDVSYMFRGQAIKVSVDSYRDINGNCMFKGFLSRLTKVNNATEMFYGNTDFNVLTYDMLYSYDNILETENIFGEESDSLFITDFISSLKYITEDVLRYLTPKINETFICGANNTMNLTIIREVENKASIVKLDYVKLRNLFVDVNDDTTTFNKIGTLQGFNIINDRLDFENFFNLFPEVKLINNCFNNEGVIAVNLNNSNLNTLSISAIYRSFIFNNTENNEGKELVDFNTFINWDTIRSFNEVKGTNTDLFKFDKYLKISDFKNIGGTITGHEIKNIDYVFQQCAFENDMTNDKNQFIIPDTFKSITSLNHTFKKISMYIDDINSNAPVKLNTNSFPFGHSFQNMNYTFYGITLFEGLGINLFNLKMANEDAYVRQIVSMEGCFSYIKINQNPYWFENDYTQFDNLSTPNASYAIEVSNTQRELNTGIIFENNNVKVNLTKINDTPLYNKNPEISLYNKPVKDSSLNHNYYILPYDIFYGTKDNCDINNCFANSEFEGVLPKNLFKGLSFTNAKNVFENLNVFPDKFNTSSLYENNNDQTNLNNVIKTDIYVYIPHEFIKDGVISNLTNIFTFNINLPPNNTTNNVVYYLLYEDSLPYNLNSFANIFGTNCYALKYKADGSLINNRITISGAYNVRFGYMINSNIYLSAKNGAIYEDDSDPENIKKYYVDKSWYSGINTFKYTNEGLLNGVFNEFFMNILYGYPVRLHHYENNIFETYSLNNHKGYNNQQGNEVFNTGGYENIFFIFPYMDFNVVSPSFYLSDTMVSPEIPLDMYTYQLNGSYVRQVKTGENIDGSDIFKNAPNRITYSTNKNNTVIDIINAEYGDEILTQNKTLDINDIIEDPIILYWKEWHKNNN